MVETDLQLVYNKISAAASAGLTIVVIAGNYNDIASYYSAAGHQDAIPVSAIADSDGLCRGHGPPMNSTDGSNSNKIVKAADDTSAPYSNYGSNYCSARYGHRVNMEIR